jgi:putative transposase
MGLDCFAVLSDGERIEAPKPLAKSLKRLKKISKKHSRKIKGSRNRRKSAMRLTMLHRRIRNRRADFLHKLTTKLAKTSPALVVEDLNVRGMITNRQLSRAISDVGWSEFRRMLAYKCVWYGSCLVIAPRFYPSSKMCSSCAFVVGELPLSIREWDCPKCGAHHDRDRNAAKNLELFLVRPVGPEPVSIKVGANACGDRLCGGTDDLVRSTSTRSLKQEANAVYSRDGING